MAGAEGASRLTGRDVRVLGEARVRQGLARMRAAWFPILQAAVAGGIAYAIAHYWVGHPIPFFAPVCAWIALGFSMDRSVRKVAELAVGVAIGVGLGDVVAHLIGHGVWQISLVLFVSAMLARFIDRGVMLTTQAGVQAIVIVALPAASGGPFGRWIDAAIGGVMALAVALLTPSDPRRHPRMLAQRGLEELSGVLHLFARGIVAGDVGDVEDALVRARATQPVLDEWRTIAANARDLARVAPASRRYRDELTASVDASVLTTRAMNNARVLLRRTLALLEADVPHDLRGVGSRVDTTARAVDELAVALGTGRGLERARASLTAAAHALDPFVVEPDDWQVQSLVLLQRSLLVDVLEAAGVPPRAAREALPEI
ncbi:FUSC family protein [Cellulomonas edaphi]|uniref:FUSC family protein n=1 Tax=Cellulomonas edaphi TaxID=3053468 RepID=A0ABT7S2C2_9CELL|nr:FUSC family protein [Cellulomons edaphi]MDM7829769.1 FUSC family protein [Cellulomons edaphi]